MKYILSIIAIVLVAVAFLTPTSAVAQGNPDNALLFTFNGLSNLGTSAFNGGIGAKHFIDNNTAVVGSFGYSSTAGDVDETSVTLGLQNYCGEFTGNGVNAFYGFEGSYGYTGATEVSTYGVGAFVGAEVFVLKNTSLGAEYGVGYTTDSVGGNEAFSVGAQSGQFTLAFYF